MRIIGHINYLTKETTMSIEIDWDKHPANMSGNDLKYNERDSLNSIESYLNEVIESFDDLSINEIKDHLTEITRATGKRADNLWTNKFE